MFHHTEFNGFKAGDVVRVFDGPFGDAVILGFDEKGEAKVSRPYAYASSTGTVGPVVLLGSETYSLPTWHFKEKVGGDRVV